MIYDLLNCVSIILVLDVWEVDVRMIICMVNNSWVVKVSVISMFKDN